jgi:hypothetical protein
MIRTLCALACLLQNVTPALASEWTFDLVVLVHSEAAGKHSATLAGPARTGPAELTATQCAELMLALTNAGLTAACVPSGLGPAVQAED